MVQSSEVGVSEFVEALLERVRKARADLVAARKADDVYAVTVALGELDDAERLAREHGFDTEAAGADEG
ncbi:hypothetical protein MOV08_41740 [Streptomyces yunnanensis]|uniref:Uncharacterized protein n=1 Tax=Streptomyces yunnanensis TaxID=156453 RepID=A0ABY8AJL4_9ACTN|nr:hypothetical protein [Streptomyces yunnanensis]WEB45178.1 hypothetical protein MOV08_41740 [Streptomyces yunnanensis]